MSPEIVSIDSISAVPAKEWDALAQGHPLVSHAYLEALEATHCVAERTGWMPTHLVLRRSGAMRAAMPLYAKAHSWGEYVFDHAWAQAYERYGMDYYTPSSCARCRSRRFLGPAYWLTTTMIAG